MSYAWMWPVMLNSGLRDELFFGNFDLLIAYRNPPSHGIEVSIAKVNMQMIEASLSKLEGILGIGPINAF